MYLIQYDDLILQVIFSACVAASFGSIIPHGGFYGGFPGPLADQVPASVAGLQGHPNGAVTPVETPSVLAARRDHFIAKDAAYAAAGPFLAGAPAIAPGPVVAPAIAGPRIAAPAFGPAPVYGHTGVIPTGPYGSPTGALQSLPNGAVVPVEEPAVAAARADHFAAKGGLNW